MKNKWKWVYNPFEKTAGWKAFGIGLIILCITTVAGYFWNMVFYGISIKIVPCITLGSAFFLQALGLAVLVFVMWTTAMLFAKKVRFQDILGTVTLAKYPLILAAVVVMIFSNRLNEFTEKIMSVGIYEIIKVITISDYVFLIAFSILSFIIIIWEIVLLFNAFRVSTNLKGIKSGLLFASIMIISEIITFILVYIYSLYK